MAAEAKSSGIGFFSLLTILFIGLKLTKQIDWTWFWVLSPTLLPIILLIIGGTIWGLYSAFKQARKIKRAKKSFEKAQGINTDISAKYKSKWQTKYAEVLENQKKIENLKKGSNDGGLGRI